MKAAGNVPLNLDSLFAYEDMWVRGRVSSSALRGADELHEQGFADHRAQAERPPGGSHRQRQDPEPALFRALLATQAQERGVGLLLGPSPLNMCAPRQALAQSMSMGGVSSACAASLSSQWRNAVQLFRSLGRAQEGRPADARES